MSTKHGDKPHYIIRRGKEMSIEEKKKIIALYKNGESQALLAKKFNRSVITISRLIHSEEGKQFLGERVEKIEQGKKEKAATEVQEQVEKNLMMKFLAGTISTPELEQLKRILSTESLQGQAELVAKKSLVEALGKGYADAIFKTFMENLEIINKWTAWKAYYGAFAREHGVELVDFVEEALQYAVEVVKEQEKKKSHEISWDDMMNYVITLKMIRNLNVRG
jgi:transposase